MPQIISSSFLIEKEKRAAGGVLNETEKRLSDFLNSIYLNEMRK